MGRGHSLSAPYWAAFPGPLLNREAGLIRGQSLSLRCALSQPMARALPVESRRKLVFAPTKYLDREFLHKYRIDFQQLSFQIYKAIESLEQ